MKKLVMILCMLFIFSGCAQEEKLTYDSFNHIDHWDQLETIEDGLVIIYFYSEYCPVCVSIADDVLRYADLASQTHTIYFIETSAIHEQGMPGFDLPSTPSLIILEDNQLLEFQRGPINTVDYLKNLT